MILFEAFRPMEPLSADNVPDSSDYFYQVKWDGVRMIAHVGHNRVMLHNRKRRERTMHYPELGCLLDLTKRDVILDGEIVALKEGRPSFPLVLERDLVTPSATKKMERLMSRIPVFYMVFDIVWHNGKNVANLSLKKRQEILQETLTANDYINHVESFSEGQALFNAIREKKMEGIVAKLKDSVYLEERKHASWLKIKVKLKQLVAVGGFVYEKGMLKALLVGAYHQGKLTYLGRVASGLSNRDVAALVPYLNDSVIEKPPFFNASSGKNKVWVKPKLTALIEFAEWTEDLRMRHPVICGFTKDHPDNCLLT